MSKKEQNKEPKTQTVEQPKEQPVEEQQEQPMEEQQEQPVEEQQEQPAGKGGKKGAVREGDGETAKRLMKEYGVEKIYKAGNYWFKKHDDAEAWAKQQGCKVEEYGRAEE